jgi:hypothetical protein
MEEKSLGTPVLLLFFDGIFSMLQNVFAFTVLAMVTTLSYAVANATKRVVIIGASLVFLQNPVEKTTDLLQVTDKALSLSFTTLVVIGTDCLGS